MNKNELIEFLQRQIDFLQGKLDEALASVNSLTLANNKLVSSNEQLTATVEELKLQIASLEEMLKGKGSELSKAKAAQQAMRRLQEPQSEKQPRPTPSAKQEPQQRMRTNNGAKKKTHPECEIEVVEEADFVFYCRILLLTLPCYSLIVSVLFAIQNY